MPAGMRGNMGLVTHPIATMARPIAYTPTVTWPGNTITTQSGFYLKTPGLLQVWITFVETAGVANGVLTATIPTGYTAVSMAGALEIAVGFFYVPGNSGATLIGMSAAPGATTQISTSVNNATGASTSWRGIFSIPTVT
jgi:hypothetical protein